MLRVAFSSKHCSAYMQPHRGASMAVDPCIGLIQPWCCSEATSVHSLFLLVFVTSLRYLFITVFIHYFAQLYFLGVAEGTTTRVSLRNRVFCNDN